MLLLYHSLLFQWNPVSDDPYRQLVPRDLDARLAVHWALLDSQWSFLLPAGWLGADKPPAFSVGVLSPPPPSHAGMHTSPPLHAYMHCIVATSYCEVCTHQLSPILGCPYLWQPAFAKPSTGSDDGFKTISKTLYLTSLVNFISGSGFPLPDRHSINFLNENTIHMLEFTVGLIQFISPC